MVVYNQEDSFPWGNSGRWGPTMANDLIWSRTQMEEGFDSAEHNREMLEAHTKTIQMVAQSLRTDSGTGAPGSATGSGSAAASGDNLAETPVRRGLMVARNRVPYQKYMDVHIFQNTQVTLNKMVHKKRHHFLAQFSMPFHMV